MKPRVFAVLFVVIAASGVVGCRTAKNKDAQDVGTSTGLPYRPPGKATYVDLPPNYPVYPTPKPLVR